jgi:hypothetical protein
VKNLPDYIFGGVGILTAVISLWAFHRERMRLVLKYADRLDAPNRVPINIRPETREKLRNLLLTPEFQGVGYSDFIDRAVNAALETQQSVEGGRRAMEVLEEVAELTKEGMSVVEACKVVKARLVAS